MHEAALCQRLVEIIEQQAEHEGFSRVLRVRLEIGAFAGVEIAAMRFGFTAVSRGTISEGAELEIEALPGRAYCLECSTEVVVQRRFDPCPQCGNPWLQSSGGDELNIRELEVA
ncbi:hydrogenase maturation nickel metallochaperone HypA [Halorhodospira abdelmalekii]|uniref:hydrogenase maturation nickel metallochaperone HypA n=1 Tax=Halorhodospira abdelmalekii TaxID=421629 RepID=UPI001903AEC2|nr:hydrogenase maturation nickel metallochaperone HypA [Halorhodospira abdelmalekii]